MSAESKILTGVLASVLTGLGVSLHVVDPSQADTVSGLLQTGFGLLISLTAIVYGLEALLVSHKAEVANAVYTSEEPAKTTTPPTPTTPTPPQSDSSVSSPQAVSPAV